MKSAVYDTSYGKFQKSDNTAPCKTTQDKTAVSHIDIYQMNQQECQSTSENHGPVSVTTCNNFHKAVNDSSETENCKIFSYSVFCQYNHRYYIVLKN